MQETLALPPGGSGAMFDRIAPRYDLVNRVLSLGLDPWWRRRAASELSLDPSRPTHVLDLATGTGDLAITIARLGPDVRVTGTDPSRGMLAIGAHKVERAGLAARVALRVGDAQAIEAESGTYDGATIAFGIRNVPDRDLALREMRRVVRPGGRVVVLELGEPGGGTGLGAALGPLARFHVRVLVPRIGALLSGAREYRYLQTSIAAFPPAAEFASAMERAGLSFVRHTPLTFGACTLYVGQVP